MTSPLEAYFGIIEPISIHSAKIIDFPTPPGRRSDAERLYQSASAIDEDPRRFAEATNLYKHALRLDPKHDRSWTNLGNISYRLKLVERAEECYWKALAISPSQPEAHFNLGIIYYNNENYDAAAGLLEGAIAGDAAFADAHYYLGFCLAELDHVREAMSHLVTFLTLDATSDYADSARGLLKRLSLKPP